MKSKSLKVGLVQQACDAARDVSIEKTIKGIREAASRGAQLVVLQELHTNLYFCQQREKKFFDLAETIPGPSTTLFSELAKMLDIVIVISLFEKSEEHYYNTAVVLERDGTIAGKYRKIHIPSDPEYYCEDFYFSPGNLGCHPIKTSLGSLGVLVCWDQWFPEAARSMALAGADVLIYPTAIGWVPVDDQIEQHRQREAWITIQRGHAIANCLPVIVCNRVGFEAQSGASDNGIQFWGSSFIAGGQGEIIEQAPTDQELVLIAELDLSRTEQLRTVWPFIQEIRKTNDDQCK